MSLEFIIKKISAGNDEVWEICKNEEGYEDVIIILNREHIGSLINALKEGGFLSGYSVRCNSYISSESRLFKHFRKLFDILSR